MTKKYMRTPFSRLWLIENRAGPVNTPTYQSSVKANSPSWSFGDSTPIREPDPDRYGAFRIVDRIKGERGLPTLPITARYKFTISEFLRLARIGCPFDLQVHMGECKNPADFNHGWEKVLVLEAGDISNWSPEALGALEQGEDAVVNENVDVTGLDLYEIKQLMLTELAKTTIVQEVIDVTICDSVQCGACGIPSDGCQIVFAICRATGASPGLPPLLVWSRDGGVTINTDNIDSLPANANPSAITCVGEYLVVTSTDDCSIHYAPIVDILDGVATWTEITTGLVCAAGAPNHLFSLGASLIWLVGNGGYIYFSDDITGGVEVQDAGIATTQSLKQIMMLDEINGIAVGDSNAVVTTTNGKTWASITGPVVGVNLNCCWMKSAEEWFVGSEGGRLYYTRNGGISWTEKVFPGAGTGEVRDIVFANNTVGYMAHYILPGVGAQSGRILRTIDGGYSWYVLPEGTGTIPANDWINAIAACVDNPNVIYAGGMASDGSDGILIKGE